MSYTKKQFLEDVASEARALKEHATKEEIGKLSAAMLDPNSSEECLYGLMTGNCFSERASELIYKSCPRYFHHPGLLFSSSMLDFDRVQQNVNGSSIEGVQSGKQLRDYRSGKELQTYFSAIEMYISSKDSKPDSIIDFLKGNREDLVL